jgi:hypothetical protein
LLPHRQERLALGAETLRQEIRAPQSFLEACCPAKFQTQLMAYLVALAAARERPAGREMQLPMYTELPVTHKIPTNRGSIMLRPRNFRCA